MEAHDIKEAWKTGVERNIKPYPEGKLNEMAIESMRKPIETVYPGTVFRLVVVAVVVYPIVMLFIREQSMEKAYADIAALAIPPVSYFLWERFAHRTRKYVNNMVVKEWSEYRVKEAERDVEFNIKHGRTIYTCSLPLATGFYVFYLMAMNIAPDVLDVIAVPLGIAIYLLITGRSLGRNYRKILRGLRDLYKQFEVED